MLALYLNIFEFTIRSNVYNEYKISYREEKYNHCVSRLPLEDSSIT